ncbi:acyl carrier protein [Streptomyces sp. NPDC059785]|uniref:acyl carrier protein n=1 Tax=Streptomyces sp. NPDC059785 TaxID=3346945 RepID=UPI0036650DC8
MDQPVLPQQFVRLLNDLFRITADRLTPSTTFEDLGLDSLALMELVVSAEQECGLVLPERAMDLTPGTRLDEAARVLSAAVPSQQGADTPSALEAS